VKYLLIILLLSILAHSAKSDESFLRTIKVLGNAKSTYKANIVQITMGASYTDSNISVAMNKTNSAIAGLLGICKSLKIDTNDIKTVDLSMNRDMDYNTQNGRIFKGYDVSNFYSIKTKNFKLIDSLVSRVSSSGINEIHSISFGHDKIDSLRESLTQSAIDNARAKAELMAKKAGMKLGKPIKIRDAASMDVQNQSSDMVFGSGGPSIQSGSLSISLQVSIEYELLE